MTSQPSGPDPAILRRRLPNTLRKTREAANRTQREVSQAMDWSVSKLIRIESGTVNISTNDLRMLMLFCETPPHQIDEFIAMAMTAKGVPPYKPWRSDVSPTLSEPP